MKNGPPLPHGSTGVVHRLNDWWRRVTSPVRLLPDFVIIGAQRGGTTSLYAYLTANPCIPPASRKEVHFFDLYFKKGLQWYRSHFPIALLRGYTERIRGERLTAGEATPAYLFHPAVPVRMARALPQVKLIAMLRNPVDRAYSHYWQKVALGRETLPFEEVIANEPPDMWHEWKRAVEGSSREREAVRHYSRWLRRHSYLSRGVYVDQLQEWAAVFSRDQMLVLCSEDFFSDPAAVLGKVCEFIDVPHCRLQEYKKHRQGQYPEMAPATRQRLIDHYREHNERLYAFLGTRFPWDR